MRAYTLVSGIFFLVIAVAHVLRAIAGVPIRAADMQLPIWVSWPAAIFTAALAIWAFSLFRKKT